jgi:rhodanese-related sulfurtransferase
MMGDIAAGGADDLNAVPIISVHQVRQMLGQPEVVIIDVRKNLSWWQSTTKISTAVREDPSEVDEWAGKYSKDQTLIFYCA